MTRARFGKPGAQSFALAFEQGLAELQFPQLLLRRREPLARVADLLLVPRDLAHGLCELGGDASDALRRLLGA